MQEDSEVIRGSAALIKGGKHPQSSNHSSKLLRPSTLPASPGRWGGGGGNHSLPPPRSHDDRNQAAWGQVC